MKKSKFLLLTTLSTIISLPFLSASCITEAKADNKMEKDIKINENKDEKNSSETMNDKQKQDKSNIDSKMEEKTDKDSSKTEEGKSMKNKHADEKNSSETMNDKQKKDKSSTDSKTEEKAGKDSSKSEEGKSMENEHADGKNSSETMNDEQKQDSKPNPESNSGNQDSKTDGSRHESTTPSESMPNDIQTENSEISKNLNKVMEYGKEAWELVTLLSKREEKAKELITKYYEIWPIVKKFFQLHEELEFNSEETKKQIEKKFEDPESKKELLDFTKRYEETREKIENAIMELKDLKNGK
ncbi:variable surface lipoprotein [Mycoplasmopsis bovis]